MPFLVNYSCTNAEFYYKLVELVLFVLVCQKLKKATCAIVPFVECSKTTFTKP